VTGSSTDATPIGFVLRVPASWTEFDLWRASRTGDLARMVDARIAEAPELAPRRGVLLRLMREAAQTAERNGAQWCAVSNEVADTDGGGMLAAVGIVFQTAGAPDPADNTVEAMAAQITAVAASAGTHRWRRVELVDLPAGRAVRVYGIQAAQPDDGRHGVGVSVDVVTMQTLIPVPGDNGVLNVVLTSPQLDLTEPMLGLFEAISSTLTWTRLSSS
jgi:hypothetical protein